MAPRRLALLTVLAAALGLAGGAAAVLLLRLIGLITNLALFHRVGTDIPSFAGWQPGLLLVPAAMAGGLVVSLLARRWPVIRGHGIPETMEAVLLRQSRIPPGVAVAKPVSAAVSIGTGGPFGAEGPIIVTGGALGSLAGQFLHVSPAERKILLACGAAAGMAATFGAPLAAVILAFELLLFEFSTRALVPLVMTEKLVRRGVPVHTHYEADILRTTRVSAVMTRIVETLRADATVGDALARFGSGPHTTTRWWTPRASASGWRPGATS
ncbi:MAG: chloride channel protein [Actinomycetota bacterium]